MVNHVMQESGIEWVGEIPQGWKLNSLKRLLNEPLKYGANEAAELDDITLPRYIRITDFDSNGKLKKETFKSLPLEKAKGYFLRSGDVLFARSGATVGKTFIYYGGENEACFAGYLIKATANERILLPEFLYFYTKSPLYEIWKGFIFTQATIQNIGADKYAYLPIIVPPRHEQQKISAYLDQHCAKLDKVIALKQQQIKTLEALRQSTIYQAVTKGLDDTVPLVDSGVEWLGDVPEGWRKYRVKDISEFSPTYSSGKPKPEDSCTVIPMESVSNKGELKASKLQQYKDVIKGLTLFENGDVIFAKITPCMENGKGAYVESLPTQYAFGSTEFHVMRATYELNGKFLYYYTFNDAFRDYAAVNMTGAAGQKRVSTNFLKYTKIYLPEISEQQKIADYLDQETQRLNTLKENLNQQINTLQAYKKSLIYEMVTGKKRLS